MFVKTGNRLLILGLVLLAAVSNVLAQNHLSSPSNLMTTAKGAELILKHAVAACDSNESLPSPEAIALPGQPSGDFSLSITPSKQTLTAGLSTSFTLSAAAVGTFTDPINLSVSVDPSDSDITTLLSADSITAGASATLTVSAAAATTPNTFTITVAGTSGALSHTATATVDVVTPDFSITVNPDSTSVTRGRTFSTIVTVNAINGFANQVQITVSDTKEFKLKMATGANPALISPGIGLSYIFKTKHKTPAGEITLTFSAQDLTTGRVRSAVLTVKVKKD
jgi:hypothetical protein